MKRFLAAAILVLLLCLPATSFACSACRDDTAGSAPQTREGLRKGILVLGIPAAAVFVGILALAWNMKPRGEEGAQAGVRDSGGVPPPTK